MRNFYIVLLLIGIGFRCYMQFFYPTFNVDEIALGNNIKESGFLELLYPLNYNQSAPPLYLWLQKVIISISFFDFWISIKLLSFFASSLTLFYFFKFAQKHNFALEFLLVFIILIFNPYIVYNSLTVKQYTFDALGVVILLYYFKSSNFKKYDYIFFLIWSLISNLGLFGCAGYLIYLFFNNYSFNNIFLFVKDKYKVVLSVLPYLIYFIWFMQQPKAIELKNYMTIYWKDSFFPLNETAFKHLFMLMHGFWVFFYSMVEFVGLFLFFISVIGFLIVLKKENRNVYYFNEIMLLFSIFLVHFFLNILNLYPLSDRLYLYLSFLFLVLLLASLKNIIEISFFKKQVLVLVFSLSMIILFSYKDYILFKENDVICLNKKLNQIVTSENIYLTPKSYKTVNDFNKFTDYRFKSKKRIEEYFGQNLNSFILVSRIPNKIKPNKKAIEEMIVINLKKDKNVNLLFEIKGYNVYKVNNVTNY